MKLLDKLTSAKTVKSSSSGDNDSMSTDPSLHWRLFYLRRRVLCFFLAVWALLIVALELLLAFSSRGQGLASSTSNLYYLWTYGPAAALTLLAVVWARVEFQAKLAAPWTRKAEGLAEARRAWATDYLSMLQPSSIFKAVRNGDLGVAAATLVSVLFTAMIIISSGLITLTPTTVMARNVPIVVQTQFLNDSSRLGDLAYTLPAYRLMIGLLQANLTYPSGVTSENIYQTIQPAQPGNIKLNAQVEGLTPRLACEQATIADTSFDIEEFDLGVTTLNSSLTSSGCKNMEVSFIAPNGGIDPELYFSQLVLGGCDGSDASDDRRIGIIYGNGSWTNSDLKVFTLHASAQLICKPSYTVSNFELVQNGTQMESLVPAANPSPRALDKVHPWDIAQAYYNSHNIPYNYDAESPNALISYPVFDRSLYLDRYMSLALFMNNARPANTSSGFDPSTLASHFEQYYQSYAALVAHQSLVEAKPLSTTGTGLTIENRLVVQALASHAIASLLALSMLLAIPTWFALPKSNMLPRNPSSIIGVATLAARSHHNELLLLTEPNVVSEWTPSHSDDDLNGRRGLAQHWGPPRKAGFTVLSTKASPSIRGSQTNDSASKKQLRRSLRSRLTRPFALHPFMRLGMASSVLIIIAALVVLLNVSRRGNGLGFVSQNTYMHFIWTSGPAFILSLLRLHYSAADFQTRALAPYVNLREGANFRKSMQLDLLNQYTVTALSKAIRMGLHTVSATTLVVLVTAFLPVFSASLFFDAIFPQDFGSQLQLLSSFGAPNPVSASERLGFDLVPSITGLVLENNLTYPPSTFENLAFPSFSLDNPEFNLSRMTVDATIPAVRPLMTCRLYDMSSINTNLTRNYSVPTYGVENPLRINIDGEDCGLTDEEVTGSNFIFSTTWNDASGADGIFGTGDTIGEITPGVLGCSKYLFVWGSISTTSSTPIKSISAMGCNESLEVVDAAVTLFGDDLHIDPDHPPVVDEATARPTESFMKVGVRYTSLSTNGQDPNNTFLNVAFTFATNSRFAIPYQMLADPDQADTVAKALQFQHGVIVTQTLGGKLRGPANNNNFTSLDAAMATVTGGGNASVPFPVTVRDPVGTRRVLQDATSTYIIVSLLWVTLVLALLAWVLMGDSAILEGSPTCVKDVVALLRKGDVLDRLPEGAVRMSPEELAWCFGAGTKFRLGWRWTDGNEPVYMLYTND